MSIRNIKGIRFRLCMALFSIACSSQIQAQDITPRQYLMQQVLSAEANYRDDLVAQALYRLDLIAPDDPEVLAARLRLALRNKNQILAEQLLNKLKQIAPDSDSYKKARLNLVLAQPEGEKILQQARLLAVAGKYSEAKQRYDMLFHGDLPTLALAVEYWSLVSKIPTFEGQAINKMEAIYEYLYKNNVIHNNGSHANWVNALQSTLSRLVNIQGERALKANNLTLAEHQFKAALMYNNTNDFAVIGLGDIAFARKDYATAERYYKEAARLYPEGSLAVYGLVSVYRLQSPQKALNYLNSLSLSKQFKFKDLKQQLRSTMLQLQAEQCAKRKQWFEALQKYQKAHQLTPDDPWLTYHLANTLHELKQDQNAHDLLLGLITKNPNNPTVIYIYAQYLSSTKQDEKALAYLHKIPEKFWNKEIHDLQARIEKQLAVKRANEALEYATKLRDGGNKAGANAYLLKQPKMSMITLRLGDWALQDGNTREALAYYRAVRLAEPENADALLGEIEALVASKQLQQARRLLELQEPTEANLNFNMQRRIANAWVSVGDSYRGFRIFQRIKAKARAAKPDMLSALVFRDAAILEKQLQLPKLAQSDFAQAMVKSNITTRYPLDNDTYTYLSRNHKEDDWLKRGIRADAALLFHQQETRITAEHDNWSLVGTPGTSELLIKEDIIQADMPLHDGRAYARGDIVYVDSGTFPTNNGFYFDDFGTCDSSFGCHSRFEQDVNGLGGSMGWQNRQWAVDIGTTPLSFSVPNTLGGIAYSNIFHNIGWTLALARRPMANSLLSLAGTQDPNTGIRWGGVVASGPNLSLSYDRGGSFGLWAYLEADQVSGKNVLTNYRGRWMGGYYYKLINEDNRRASIGINNMFWHYQTDLSGFTLGQGGYYSPQSYLSFALPIDFRKRTANWSYEWGGSVSWATADVKDSMTYPLPFLYPPITISQNSVVAGGRNEGPGYTLLALLERRLSSHWTCGGVINIQRTQDFTPSHISLYIRYSMEGWMGDLDMPIRPLVPYANFS